MVLPQLQVLLHLVDDAAPPGVDAEVLERELEVRDVRLHLHLKQLSRHEHDEEQDLLREGQDERAERRDVGLQGLTWGKNNQIGISFIWGRNDRNGISFTWGRNDRNCIDCTWVEEQSKWRQLCEAKRVGE